MAEDLEVIGLDWDEEIDDGEEFERVLFEPGNYDFTVKKFERARTKESGNNMAVLDLEVTDGKKKTTIKDWLVLTNKSVWKIASYFRSVGLKKHGEKMRMKWKESVGLSGRCTLDQEERESKKGKTYTVNTIQAYLDPDEETEDIQW